MVSSRCSYRDAGTPCVYGSRKSTRIVAGAARRRFAAASPHRSLVGRHPRRFRAASRPTSRAYRYPGAAPRSRPATSASGPLQLSASVCVNMPNLSYILPLHCIKPKLIDPPYRPVRVVGPLLRHRHTSCCSPKRKTAVSATSCSQKQQDLHNYTPRRDPSSYPTQSWL